MTLNFSVSFIDSACVELVCRKCKHVQQMPKSELMHMLKKSGAADVCLQCHTAYMDLGHYASMPDDMRLNFLLTQIRVNLTKEQKNTVETVAALWLAKGLCTDPVDEAAAAHAISMAYAAEGHKPPTFVFCKSPGDYIVQAKKYAPWFGPGKMSDDSKCAMDAMQGLLPPAVASLLQAAQPKIWRGLGSEVCLSYQEGQAELAETTWNPLWRAVGNAIERRIRPLRDLHNAVEARLMETVTDDKLNWLIFTGTDLCGTADKLAWFDAMDKIDPPKVDTDRLKIAQAAHCAAWSIYSFTEVCFVCDRPEFIFHPSAEDNLGGDEVARVRFRDGFEGVNDLED